MFEHQVFTCNSALAVNHLDACFSRTFFYKCTLVVVTYHTKPLQDVQSARPIFYYSRTVDRKTIKGSEPVIDELHGSKNVNVRSGGLENGTDLICSLYAS